MAAATIKEVLRFDSLDGFRPFLHEQQRESRGEVNAFNANPLPHVRAALPGVLEQNRVELRAFNLKGRLTL